MATTDVKTTGVGKGKADLVDLSSTEVVAPLVDALSQMFHSSSKLNNGINIIEERIGKLEKQALDSEKETVSVVSDMGADLSLVLDNVIILDSKINNAVSILKTGLEELSKRMTQLTVDISQLVTNVKIKKR